MLELGLKALAAYLLGAMVGSLVIGLLRGIDIRAMGSGNAGATNALRTQGKAFGAAVLGIDIAKGVIAVAWLPALVIPGIGADPGVSRSWMTLACGLAVVLGHVFPVWFGFRGGKGAATIAGVVGAIDVRLLVPMLLGWFVVVALSGYVGLATMLAGLAVTATVAFLDPGDWRLLGFCTLLTAFLVYTHRGNIARMRAGNENRVRRLWLFRPRAA
ncbi:MAG TPA: glycerol-3-phosphate 1-O-acyltransferase PlsY [Steroidobacteraceae bacterium]|nr:glycerol-3-phosphate 1-O-acyltransferase PlsY [Steroidobacteraceae bacterium]